MNRKKTLAVLGLLYGICGIGAGIVCFGQTEEEPEEAVFVAGTLQGEVEQEETESEVSELVEPEPEEIELEESELEEPEPEIVIETTIEVEAVIETEPEPVAEQQQYMVTVIDVDRRLRIRDAASMQGKIIGYMRNGDAAEVIEVGEEWHLIRFEDVEGYVSADYLELIPIQ